MKTMRLWVTSITIGSFLLIGVTGLLMFFKVKGSLIVVAHEWLSPIFFLGACLHIWLNWGAVRRQLASVRGLVVVGLFSALLLFSILPFGAADGIVGEHGHGREVAGRRAAEVLLQSRISTVAELTGHTPQQMRDSLIRCGVTVTSDDATLAEAAQQSRVSPARVLYEVLKDD